MNKEPKPAPAAARSEVPLIRLEDLLPRDAVRGGRRRMVFGSREEAGPEAASERETQSQRASDERPETER